MTQRRSEFRRMARPSWVGPTITLVQVIVLLTLIYIGLTLVFGSAGG